MADDSEFITRLISFGLSEKEALVYLHLLKYGARTPSVLAKPLFILRGQHLILDSYRSSPTS
ncbi:MAG TPA: hypothetical protein VED16_00420 [Candidatus Acidoferrum sp.]|nr:hypothetical protein [Candidatus Acidoferrum sp.]